MDSPGGCQLASMQRGLCQVTAALGPLERLRLAARRLGARALHRLGLVQAALPRRGAPGPRGPVLRSAPFQAGERVRARPLAEIEATLANGRTHGLEFMPGMAKYCGSTHRVMKRVRYFFDEREWKMRRCSAVLLDGVLCNGRDMYDKEGCDRACFFFWNDAWLERVEDGERASP